MHIINIYNMLYFSLQQMFLKDWKRKSIQFVQCSTPTSWNKLKWVRHILPFILSFSAPSLPSSPYEDKIDNPSLPLSFLPSLPLSFPPSLPFSLHPPFPPPSLPSLRSFPPLTFFLNLISELVHSSRMLDFQSLVQDNDDNSAPLLVHKFFSQNQFGAGQLLLRPGAEKGTQHVRKDTMVQR